MWRFTILKEISFKAENVFYNSYIRPAILCWIEAFFVTKMNRETYDREIHGKCNP